VARPEAFVCAEARAGPTYRGRLGDEFAQPAGDVIERRTKARDNFELSTNAAGLSARSPRAILNRAVSSYAEF